MKQKSTAELFISWEERRISEQDLQELTQRLDQDANARQIFNEQLMISDVCAHRFRENYRRYLKAGVPMRRHERGAPLSNSSYLFPLLAAGLIVGATVWLLSATMAGQNEIVIDAHDTLPVIAGDGDEAEVRAEIQALVAKLSAEEFETRDTAERQLEVYLRKSGQAAFRILEDEVLPAIKDDLEAKMRLQKVVDRLTNPTVIWSLTTGSCSFTPGAPGVNNDLGLFVQPTSYGLFAVEAATGKLLWSKEGDYHHSTPIVRNDAVFALLPPRGVAAYEPRTGRELWTFKLPFTLDGSLCFDEKLGHVLAATDGGVIVALDRFGKEVWRTEQVLASWDSQGKTYSSGSMDSPVLDVETGQIYSGISSHSLLAFDRENGKKVWELPCKAFGAIAPVIRDDGNVFVSGSIGNDNRSKSDGFVRCFEAHSRKLLWSVEIPSSDLFGQTFIDNASHLVLCPGNSTLFALDVRSGARRWQVPLSDSGPFSMVSKDGIVYAGDYCGNLTAVRLDDGNVLWTKQFDEDPAAAGAPRAIVKRRGGPDKESLGQMGHPRFVGDVLVCTTFSGWTFGLRLPPFQHEHGHGR